MAGTTRNLAYAILVLILGVSSLTDASRQLTKIEPTRHDKDSHDTQGSAYSYSTGNDPGGPGDAVTMVDAEASAAHFNGLFYKDGKVTVESGDKASGGWSGAIVKNDVDTGTRAAVSDNFDPENAFQRGVHVIAGTSSGARAVAGSGSMFGAAHGATVTATIDAYAPTAMDNVATGTRRRSVSLTNIAPTSAAQSGTGNGPAAIASGWEVASAARAARDKADVVTIGSRVPGDRGYDRQQTWGRHLLSRRQLLIRGKLLL